MLMMLPKFLILRLLKLVELEQLEEKYPEYKKKNSPTVRVGGEAVKSFGEVHHDVPMLSQQKAFSKEEILDFDQTCQSRCT